MPRLPTKILIKNHEHRKRIFRYTIFATISSLTGASLYTRKWRKEHLSTVPSASTSGLFYLSNNNNQHLITKSKQRDLNTLLTTINRAGLMGKCPSVKEELESIRKWHLDHNFRGGLVLHELTEPLFPSMEFTEPPPFKQRHLQQRECYYLYYEVLPNGEIRQQIFCRGTTLFDDFLNCLKAVFVPDEELDGARIHLGFQQHAMRLLRDVEPLLVRNHRSTVELCGHSLGGAVAIIVAMKLKRRGYNVKRLTTIGAPRICQKESKDVLAKLLPEDTLRVEHERDMVTFLPPYGVPLGDKLWFVESGDENAKFVKFESKRKWEDSVWLNFEIPEVVQNWPTVHLVPSYMNQLEEFAMQMEKQEEAKQEGEEERVVNIDGPIIAQNGSQ